jgi:hypothetical protein
MKKILLILFIAISSKFSSAQIKKVPDGDITNSKANIETDNVRNPVDSINPFKRKNPAREKRVGNHLSKVDTLKAVSNSAKPVNDDRRISGEVNNNPASAQTLQQTAVSESNIKTPDNDISFTITGCMGNQTAQTVTVFFTFSNSTKANQAIWIRAHGMGYEYQKKANAFDKDGNQFAFGGATLGQTTSNREVKTQLPTGIPVSGSIKFLNVLPSVTKFSLINIPSGNSNWNGGGDKRERIIEIKDVTINWK